MYLHMYVCMYMHRLERFVVRKDTNLQTKEFSLIYLGMYLGLGTAVTCNE
jgi:hypothetical protein